MVTLCLGFQWCVVWTKLWQFCPKPLEIGIKCSYFQWFSFRMDWTIAIALATTDHSKTDPLEIWTSKRLVFQFSVFKPSLYLNTGLVFKWLSHVFLRTSSDRFIDKQVSNRLRYSGHVIRLTNLNTKSWDGIEMKMQKSDNWTFLFHS